MTDRQLALVGGLLADGSGADPSPADVLMSGGLIDAVVPQAQRPAAGYPAQELDITGRVLAPGFVDIHTHSDLSLLAYPANESRVTQGITTEVVGNCGMSPAPVPADRSGLAATIATIDVTPGGQWDWHDAAGWLEALDRTPTSTNVAAMIGHGSVRFGVCGAGAATLTGTALADLEASVSRALAAGCLGVSLGLMYAPGEHADAAELSAVAAVAARHDAVLAAHLRDYRRPYLSRAVTELLQSTAAAGPRVQISHLRAIGDDDGPDAFAQTVAHLSEARAEIDVAADVYPYITGHTTLIQLLPPALRSLGPAAVTDACRDEPAAVATMLAGAGYGPERLTVMKAPRSPEAAGLRPDGDMVDPWAWLVALLVQNDSDVDVAVDSGHWADVDLALLTPWVSIASDGTALDANHRTSVPHPRSWGAFPTAYRRMRDLGVPIGEAVHRMTLAPAQRAGLTSGIHPGKRADLVVFDDEALDHPTSFTEPARPAIGIDHVLVNGGFVLRDGSVTSARPGALLRSAV